VRFLAQQSPVLERLAQRPGGPLQLDADPEAAAPQVAHDRRPDPFEVRQEIRPELLGPARELLVLNDLERGARDGARERVAAERAAVVARPEHAEHLARRQDRRDRIEPAGERLADHEHVGARLLVVHVREELARPPEAGLDLVGHEQHAVPPADPGHLGEVARRRNDHARFALNRLHEEAAGVRSDRVLERVGIAEGNDAEARRERREPVAVLGHGREADDGERSPVEVVGADDHFRLAGGNALHAVAPLPGRLDRGLHRLGARVHHERHLHARQLVELLVEHRELIVPEGAGGQREAPGLPDRRVENVGVTVSLADGRVAGQTVEIPAPIDVPHPAPLAALEHDVERLVVAGPVLLFEIDEISDDHDDPHAPRALTAARRQANREYVSWNTWVPPSPASAASSRSGEVTIASPPAAVT
jgi:hypothetical protein